MLKVQNTLATNPITKVASETDDEIIERLRERFSILEDMTKAVKSGKVRAMIVSGPPGVGKSFGVEKVLSTRDTFANLVDNAAARQYEVVKGNLSALHLYLKLFTYKSSKHILVFDDCDTIFTDDLALNILKAALDSSNKRVICWNTESRLLDESGIPNSFEFNGGAIFITNLKFSHVRSKKLRDHLEALESRCHYLDLTIDTEREKMLRIRQIVNDGMLSNLVSVWEEAEIINFIDDNKAKLRELSLRTVIKAAELYKSFGSRWVHVAKNTLMI